MIAKGNTLVVDVRDAPEVQKSGKVAGAIHVSRGMLEFRADPESPYHDQNFVKDKIIILYWPSRPGEFHPEPLTEPDLTPSRHPARATARRLPPSIEYRVPPVAG